MADTTHYHPNVELLLDEHRIPSQERLYRINEGYVVPGTKAVLDILGGFRDIAELATS